MCLSTWAVGQTTEIRINEADIDQPGGTGSDSLEFVELYGPPGQSLDGLVLVFFNGNSTGNPVYATYDLTGYSINDAGFFLLGSPSVPNIDAPLNAFSDAIQNGGNGGGDAIGLFEGPVTNWPRRVPSA